MTANARSVPSLAARPVTAAQLLELPDDGNRYELVQGELVATAPAGFLRGTIVDRIGRRELSPPRGSTDDVAEDSR